MFIRRAVQLGLSLLLAFSAFAQPVPQVKYPVPLTKGGTELNNTITTISTNGTLNNVALTTSILKFTGSSTQTITGIVSNAKAQKVLICNLNGSTVLNISHESASSTAANRINLPDSATYAVTYNSCTELFYDTATSRWRLTDEVIKVNYPLYRVGTTIYEYQASPYQYGYVSSYDYGTYLDNWFQSNNDIYNTNSNNVWVNQTVDDGTLAKFQVQGASACYGTPTACDASPVNTNSTTCTTQYGCSWTSYGSCYVWSSDEVACNAQVGCLFSAGTACSVSGSGDYSACVSQGGSCTWDANYSSCSDYTGSGEGACNSVTGCAWSANTCGSIGNSTDCNNASPCNWVYQNCSDFNSDEGSCNANMCAWTPASYGDCSLLPYPDCVMTSGCSDFGDHCEGMYFIADSHCDGSYGGSCQGDNSYCSGSYVSSYSCNGTFGNGCNENYYCAGTPTLCTVAPVSTDSSSCALQSGCAWTALPAISANGPMRSTTLTGTNKLVCIKSNGNMGTCTQGVDCGSACS